jgi:hypothetical protein
VPPPHFSRRGARECPPPFLQRASCALLGCTRPPAAAAASLRVVVPVVLLWRARTPLAMSCVCAIAATDRPPESWAVVKCRAAVLQPPLQAARPRLSAAVAAAGPDLPRRGRWQCRGSEGP